MGDYFIAKKPYIQSRREFERDLILKIYRKQLSLFNRGKGPKPDIESLIGKSKLKGLEISPSEIPLPGEATWLGVSTARKLEIPKLDYVFTSERRTSSGFYILTYDDGIKIGISKNIADRMFNYDKPWCRKVLKYEFLYIPYPIARDVELSIKRHYLTAYAEGSHEFFYGKSSDEIREVLHSLAQQ